MFGWRESALIHNFCRRITCDLYVESLHISTSSQLQAKWTQMLCKRLEISVFPPQPTHLTLAKLKTFSLRPNAIIGNPTRSRTPKPISARRTEQCRTPPAPPALCCAVVLCGARLNRKIINIHSIHLHKGLCTEVALPYSECLAAPTWQAPAHPSSWIRRFYKKYF